MPYPYLPLSDDDRQELCRTIGINSPDALFDALPYTARQTADTDIDLPNAQGEMAVSSYLQKMAGKNIAASNTAFFLGGGWYRHHIPSTVDHLIQRSEFLTAYTPYQPEVSQGTLQTLFEFQTQTAALLGMDVANASMYDGATACAEAASMACRITKRKNIILSGHLHPHYAETTETFMQHTGCTTDRLPPDPACIEDLMGRIDSKTACVVVQMPSFFGSVCDYSALADYCHKNGALLVAVTNPLACALLPAPGEMGADIAVAEAAYLAGPMNFGGPGLGLFATRQKYLRHMPGRLCGKTQDADGTDGFVLTLSTREQHIRREKATSNICTNAGLMALAFSIHLSLLGGKGLKHLAALNHEKAVQTAGILESLPFITLHSKNFFNEFLIELPQKAETIVDILAERQVLAGVPLSRLYPSYREFDNMLLVSATEMTSTEDMTALQQALTEVCK